MARGDETRGRARARAKVWAAELDAARRRAGLVMPAGLSGAAGRLRERLALWGQAEVSPGRLVPWLPVAFGFGIVLYFTADREPAWWAAITLALLCIAFAFLARRRSAGFPIALAFAAATAGFATATLRAVHVAHPVLQHPVVADVSGFVEVSEERERSDRIVVRVHHIEGRRLDASLERVRVAVRKGRAPPVGAFVSFKARLSPPLGPLRPGGYDFARDMYFQGIGASGFVLGAVKTAPPPIAAGAWLHYSAFVEGMREAIDDRIKSVLSGDRGAIASALITGKRDAISQPVNDAMYVSSLGHVLSISGYHMAVVAGIMFFTLRAGLALIPSFATRHPIKKWAAAAAIVAAGFYLVLSGAQVATQRSFIMVAIVLLGVIADRPALTFRTLTVAALAVMLISPEAVVHPSFQMSFAATLALIAAYQNGLPWRPDADSAYGARIALWGGREIAGLIIISIVAGLATTPYAAYHFHRLAPYGVLANLFAMPVMSLWVMPMGVLGVLTLPFGFDAAFWQLMGAGIDWMIAIATWVASLPGAVGRMAAFGTGPLLLGTAALLLLCLLRSPMRWSGAALAVIASFWAVTTTQPDVLIAADGEAVAVRGADGRLAIYRHRRDAFAVREWLRSDADARPQDDETLAAGFRCDEIGCTARLADGRIVALAFVAEAIVEDCKRAAVVVSPRNAPADCTALLIDRARWMRAGAIALYANGKNFQMKAARPAGYERPWTAAPAKSQ